MAQLTQEAQTYINGCEFGIRKTIYEIGKWILEKPTNERLELLNQLNGLIKFFHLGIEELEHAEDVWRYCYHYEKNNK